MRKRISDRKKNTLIEKKFFQINIHLTCDPPFECIKRKSQSTDEFDRTQYLEGLRHGNNGKIVNCLIL